MHCSSAAAASARQDLNNLIQSLDKWWFIAIWDEWLNQMLFRWEWLIHNLWFYCVAVVWFSKVWIYFCTLPTKYLEGARCVSMQCNLALSAEKRMEIYEKKEQIRRDLIKFYDLWEYRRCFHHHHQLYRTAPELYCFIAQGILYFYCWKLIRDHIFHNSFIAVCCTRLPSYISTPYYVIRLPRVAE